MNKERLKGIIRHVLTFVGGFAVMQGWIEGDMVNEVIGAVITTLGFVWSVKDKKENKDSNENTDN